ncbi:MAG: SufE family protein [Xanthomonadales bacterium]|nr:SufE family protein [Xanthomonadales bacterium]
MSAAEAELQAIDDTQQQIVDDFTLLGDWSERYQYLIDLGRQLAKLAPEDCVEQNLLHGCQSQVWVVASGDADAVEIRAQSDAAIVSGLIALMLKVYSGRSAAAILASEPRFIDQIGLHKHLSATRNNGLAALYQRIRAEAAARIA